MERWHGLRGAAGFCQRIGERQGEVDDGTGADLGEQDAQGFLGSGECLINGGSDDQGDA